MQTKSYSFAAFLLPDSSSKMQSIRHLIKNSTKLALQSLFSIFAHEKWYKSSKKFCEHYTRRAACNELAGSISATWRQGNTA